MATSSTSRRLPATSDGYELREQIGQGTCAAVYRAWCEEIKDEVAIKVVDLEWLQAPLEDIGREIQVMSLSSHPNVVPFSTAFVHAADLWIVMPLLTGGSVLSLMNCAFREGLPEDYAVYVLSCVLKALVYFHGNGQMHRDVKAANLMLDSNGNTMLSDYGMMGWMVEGGWDRKQRQTFVGTPCWMAPEVMEQAEGYDYKADIWSLGITAIELAQGRAPYSTFAPMKVLFLTLQNPPPTLNDTAEERFSDNYKDFVDTCLQKDPKLRPSAKQLLNHPLFVDGVKKPDTLADTIAKLPPIGSRGGSQKQLYRQLQKVAQPQRSGVYELSSKGLGWDFGDDQVESNNGEVDSTLASSESATPLVSPPNSSAASLSSESALQGVSSEVTSTSTGDAPSPQVASASSSHMTLASESAYSSSLQRDTSAEPLNTISPGENPVIQSAQAEVRQALSDNGENRNMLMPPTGGVLPASMPAKTFGLLKKGRFTVSDVTLPEKLEGKLDSFLDGDSISDQNSAQENPPEEERNILSSMPPTLLPQSVVDTMHPAPDKGQPLPASAAVPVTSSAPLPAVHGHFASASGTAQRMLDPGRPLGREQQLPHSSAMLRPSAFHPIVAEGSQPVPEPGRSPSRDPHVLQGTLAPRHATISPAAADGSLSVSEPGLTANRDHLPHNATVPRHATISVVAAEGSLSVSEPRQPSSRDQHFPRNAPVPLQPTINPVVADGSIPVPEPMRVPSREQQVPHSSGIPRQAAINSVPAEGSHQISEPGRAPNREHQVPQSTAKPRQAAINPIVPEGSLPVSTAQQLAQPMQTVSERNSGGYEQLNTSAGLTLKPPAANIDGMGARQAMSSASAPQGGESRNLVTTGESRQSSFVQVKTIPPRVVNVSAPVPSASSQPQVSQTKPVERTLMTGVAPVVINVEPKSTRTAPTSAPMDSSRTSAQPVQAPVVIHTVSPPRNAPPVNSVPPMPASSRPINIPSQVQTSAPVSTSQPVVVSVGPGTAMGERTTNPGAPSISAPISAATPRPVPVSQPHLNQPPSVTTIPVVIQPLPTGPNTGAPLPQGSTGSNIPQNIPTTTKKKSRFEVKDVDVATNKTFGSSASLPVTTSAESIKSLSSASLPPISSGSGTPAVPRGKSRFEVKDVEQKPRAAPIPNGAPPIVNIGPSSVGNSTNGSRQGTPVMSPQPESGSLVLPGPAKQSLSLLAELHHTINSLVQENENLKRELAVLRSKSQSGMQQASLTSNRNTSVNEVSSKPDPKRDITPANYMHHAHNMNSNLTHSRASGNLMQLPQHAALSSHDHRLQHHAIAHARNEPAPNPQHSNPGPAHSSGFPAHEVTHHESRTQLQDNQEYMHTEELRGHVMQPQDVGGEFETLRDAVQQRHNSSVQLQRVHGHRGGGHGQDILTVHAQSHLNYHETGPLLQPGQGVGYAPHVSNTSVSDQGHLPNLSSQRQDGFATHVTGLPQPTSAQYVSSEDHVYAFDANSIHYTATADQRRVEAAAAINANLQDVPNSQHYCTRSKSQHDDINEQAEYIAPDRVRVNSVSQEPRVVNDDSGARHGRSDSEVQYAFSHSNSSVPVTSVSGTIGISTESRDVTVQIPCVHTTAGQAASLAAVMDSADGPVGIIQQEFVSAQKGMGSQ